MYVPFLAPHTPLEAPDNLIEKYKTVEDTRKPTRNIAADRTREVSKTLLPSARPLYAAVVDALDQAIGEILLTIEEAIEAIQAINVSEKIESDYYEFLSSELTPSTESAAAIPRQCAAIHVSKRTIRPQFKGAPREPNACPRMMPKPHLRISES